MNPDVLLAASPYTTPLAPSFRNTVCQRQPIYCQLWESWSRRWREWHRECPGVPERMHAAHLAPDPHPRRQRRADVACHRDCLLWHVQPIASHFCGPCHSQCRCRVSQRSAARLWTRKAWGKTCMQMKQGLHPAADIGGGRGCASQCGMVLLLHLLLLSASALWFALLPL